MMAGSLRLLGGIVVDGSLSASIATLGTLTVGAITLTGALSAGANNITTTGTITAGAFSGSGALVTTLNGTNITTGTVADARLSTNVMMLGTAQTITTNKTFSAAANLYFAGGTTYKIDTAGSASFNTLSVAGNVTLDGNDYLTFGSAGVAAPSDTSVGTKIRLYGTAFQIGVESNSTWYDASNAHKFYTANSPTLRTLRAEITNLDTHIFTDLNVDKNLEVAGEIKAGINNEFPDPLVASKSIGLWAPVNGTLTFDPAQAPIGVGANGSICLTASAADGQASYVYNFDVTATEWITFSSYAFATTASKASQLHILWFNASMTFLLDSSIVTAATATSWTRYSVTAQAPATARYFRVRIDSDTLGGIIYFSGFQIERGKALTGFKPYQGGKELSLYVNGTSTGILSTGTLNLNSRLAINDGSDLTLQTTGADPGDLIFAAAGVEYARVWSAANTLSLSGGTSPVAALQIQPANVIVTGTLKSASILVVDAAAKLYYQGADIDARYVKTAGNSVVSGTIRMEGTGAQLFVANQFNIGAAPAIDLAIGDSDTGFNWLGDGRFDIVANSTTVATIGSGLLFDFKVAPTLNGTKIWHEGNDGAGSGLDADTLDALHATSFMRTDANTATTGTITSAGLTLSSGILSHNGVDSYDKIRVWTSAAYTIGMKSGLTFGYIVAEYAMTFTMNNSATRGFLWRDEADAASDGAMSLTTDGRLYLKGIANVSTLHVRDTSTFLNRMTISADRGENPTYAAGHLELKNATSSSTNDIVLGFHRSGLTATALIHTGDVWGSGQLAIGTTDSTSRGTLEVERTHYRSTTTQAGAGIEWNATDESLDFVFYT
jgi:hypothetical protein